MERNLPQPDTMDRQMITGKKALNSLFDDAIDELEVTYDVYFELESYRARCIHILHLLLSSGIKDGKVLVFGSNEKPFSMVCEKLGFQTEGTNFDSSLNKEKESISSESHIPRDLKGSYDIIICDNILQHFTSPADMLTNLKKLLLPGGMLIVTTPNAVRGTARLRLLMGENIYPLPSGNALQEEEGPHLQPYREYTLSELETVVKDIGLELIKSEFITGTTVNANMWPPLPLKEYFLQTISHGIQKVAVPLRNYLSVAARKPRSEGMKSA